MRKRVINAAIVLAVFAAGFVVGVAATMRDSERAVLEARRTLEVMYGRYANE